MSLQKAATSFDAKSAHSDAELSASTETPFAPGKSKAAKRYVIIATFPRVAAGQLRVTLLNGRALA
jgi:hypothetical protein